jgi:hypothetical protein
MPSRAPPQQPAAVRSARPRCENRARTSADYGFRPTHDLFVINK